MVVMVIIQHQDMVLLGLTLQAVTILQEQCHHRMEPIHHNLDSILHNNQDTIRHQADMLRLQEDIRHLILAILNKDTPQLVAIPLVRREHIHKVNIQEPGHTSMTRAYRLDSRVAD
jgi:hypothetical protein